MRLEVNGSFYLCACVKFRPVYRQRPQGTNEEEGIFVGVKSGGTLSGALQVAAQAPKGANILCMHPDTGERYLSTPLFAEVLPEVNGEEWEIARSTPGCILEEPKRSSTSRMHAKLERALSCRKRWGVRM
jgi:hypothetical protein